MNAQQARIAILTLLYRKGHATRHEILALREMTVALYDAVRGQLLSENLAFDGPEGGLTYVGRIPFADALHVLDVLHARDLADTAWREYRAGVKGLSAEHRVFLPLWLAEAERWDDLETLLTDLTYLEARNAADELVDLIDDIAKAVTALPGERERLPILKLLLEALRRDADFIACHAADYPQGLFQCLWNSGWWYDCPQAAAYKDPRSDAAPCGAPLAEGQGPKLCALLERWRAEREHAIPGFCWIRALRPPTTRLGEAQDMFRAYAEEIQGLTFSPDGRLVATHLADHTVRVWNVQTGTPIAVLRGHRDVVSSVSYSSDGQRIATGSADGTVRVWDARNGAEVAVCRPHGPPVTCVRFSPDGHRIAVADISRGPNVQIWDDRYGGNSLIAFRGHIERVECLAWSLDGRRIASGSDDRTVRLWDLVSQTSIELRGHEAAIRHLAYSPDGARIASGSDDGTVRVWDAEQGTALGVLRGYIGPISRLFFSSDGRRIASASLSHRAVWVWDAEKYKSLKLVEGSDDAQAMLTEPNGAALLALIGETEMQIVRADTRRSVAFFPGRFMQLFTASCGGDWIGTEAHALHILRLEGDRSLAADRQLVTSAAVSEDAKRSGKRAFQKAWLSRCTVAAVATGLILTLGLGEPWHRRLSTLHSVRRQLKEAAQAPDAPKNLKGIDWDTASLADVQIEIEPSAMNALIVTHWLWEFWYLWGAIVFCVCLVLTCYWIPMKTLK